MSKSKLQSDILNILHAASFANISDDYHSDDDLQGSIELELC